MTITRLLGSVTLVMAGGLSLAAPVPKGGPPPAGVFVLDDCDPDFKGKAAYEDNLSAISPSGKLVFRVSGVNGCESIGSNHIIANDPDRKRVWALEYAGKRICQYDHSGKRLLTVDDVQVSAAAVDPTTGNLWVLISKNGIKTGETIVLDSRGKKVATHPVNGWDIIYDPKGKAFWVAGRNLTKMSAKDGTVLSVQPIATWCASSLDVHPTTGRVWVATRKDDKVPGDENLILQFDNNGTLLRTVELGAAIPFKVSVDSATGAVWVAILRKSVRRYSAGGKLEAEYKFDALSVEAIPGGAWVVTSDETVRLSADGKPEVRVKHMKKSSQAWTARF